MIIAATPTRESILGTTTSDLFYLGQRDPDVKLAVAFGTYLPNLRNSLAETAQRAGASHILFIDSDMRFPPDVAQRLRSHNLDVVGANCRQRTADGWTAFKDGKQVSSAGKVGTERVDTLGMGVTLIKTSVFSRLPRPWFPMQWDSTVGKYVGEDVGFCLAAKAAGINIWIDHSLSSDIRHTATEER